MRQGEVLTIAEEFAQVGIHEVKSDLVEQAGMPLWNLVVIQIKRHFMTRVSPGEELKNLLMKLHPNNKASGFVQQLDYHLAADGQLEDLVYHSCINYLIGRCASTQTISRDNGLLSEANKDEKYMF